LATADGVICNTVATWPIVIATGHSEIGVAADSGAAGGTIARLALKPQAQAQGSADEAAVGRSVIVACWFIVRPVSLYS
jgi:hypothetical protein